MKSSTIRSYSGCVNSKCLIAAVLAAALICSAAVVWAAEGAHGEEQGKKGWIATDTYRVMNFLVLAAVLVLLLRKPVSQALNGRIESIKDQLKELEAKKRQAEAELAGYSEKLSLLDRDAERIVSEYIQQGEEAKARIIKEAEAAASRIEEQAKLSIDQEFKQARERLKTDVLGKALAKAERMIRENITTDDQGRLVDEYLDKVVTR
ncbi:MAG: hypothetical protein C4530_14440 [Desulfobacteraceae bacterium]|nr:MAG: hypothetical protein C4530_14440 [Desulfobacteraceae bacterium]